MRLSEAIDLLDSAALHAVIGGRGAHTAPQTGAWGSATPPGSAGPATPPGSTGSAISPGSTGSTVPPKSAAPRWADLGCGSGLFTEALARFLPRGSTLYGLDLRPTLQSDVVGGVKLIPIPTDFIHIPLPVTGLNGIIMANSFHYVEDKPGFLSMLTRPMSPGHPESAPLHPGSPLIFVEYDTDTPVPTWVPWPVSFSKLRPLLAAAGWSKLQKLGERPSAFGRSNLYAALATPV